MSMLERQAWRLLEEGLSPDEVQAALQDAGIAEARARQLVVGLDVPAWDAAAPSEGQGGGVVLGGVALSAGVALGVIGVPAAPIGALAASVGLVGYGLLRVVRALAN